MPPYPMMPFAVDAILHLREEASAKFAELRAKRVKQRAVESPVMPETRDDQRPLPMPQRPARRAA